MCKVIEKFAVKIFLEETYIITGHDPEIYHLYVYCCMYFKSLYFTAGEGRRPVFYGIGDCGTGNPSPTIYMGNIYSREMRFFNCGTSRPETAPVKNPDAAAVTSSRGA